MPSISGPPICETCGSPIETTSAGDFGCTVCLFDAALDRNAEASEVAFASVPAQLGPYAIEHHVDGSVWELGHGAMGVTYRAIDKVLDRPVALKVINTNLASRSAEARNRFMREARAAAALRHPNIATVYQFGVQEETGQFFYAMELIEGETLDELVRKLGPLDVLTTIDIALQVTAALGAAEERCLVHRDLKPGNLMLVNKASRKKSPDRDIPTVKVIDFGVAKAIAEKTNARPLTHGGFVGTPAFASPEQFANSPVDVRSDIYSLGATLWFLLTGHIPLGGETVEEIRTALRSKPLPIEQLKAARVPSRFVALLVSMLAIELAARPAGAHELAVKLHGIRTSIAHRRKTVQRCVVAAALVILAAVAGVRVFHSYRTNATLSAGSEKSIAVLPFQNLSNDKEDSFFADGLQDETISDLARLADLKVISRISANHYRGETAGNSREIGRQLGVAHLLEGSVQRVGNRLRVHSQLIDARIDAHVWAQTYDRPMTDIFAIQSEIARSIAEQLHAKISPTTKAAIEEAPTTDLSAFDLYTRAKNLLLTASVADQVKVPLLEAVDLLDQAVTRDPSFFQAFCCLARAHDRLYFLGYDHTPARLAAAEAAMQAASRLRPDAGEVHLARAENLYDGYLDYDGALAELEVARQSLPNHARIFQLMGFIQRRQGHWEESARSLDRAVALDPRDLVTLQEIAISEDLFRRYAEEKSTLDGALAIEPNHVESKLARANVDLNWKADPKPLHQMIDEVRAANLATVASNANYWLACALAERDAAAAKEALVALGDTAFRDGSIQMSHSFVEGLIARMTLDSEKARATFTAARAEQEKIVRAEPNYGPARCVLGLIYAALGRKEEALREGRSAVELVPVEKDVIRGPAMHRYLAKIAAWVGDKDLACQQLTIATPVPSGVSYGDLKLMPWWDPLRGDPRFERIVASLAPK